MWPNFEQARDFRPVLFVWKNDVNSIINEFEGAILGTTFSPLYVYGGYFQHSRAVNSEVNSPTWPEYMLVRDFMPAQVICNFFKDMIKTEQAIIWQGQTLCFSPPKGK